MNHNVNNCGSTYLFLGRPTRGSSQLLATFPRNVLERIFAFVCPHSRDESYETCEQSAVDNACMLCDLRDLAHAGQVCKKWRKSTIPIMYYSIRIDSVHYCNREGYLAERRKYGSFFDRNADPEDPSRVRLSLLARTVREDPTRLGKRVHFLKIPYMLREAAQADLARTIAVMPNLRYVDLPEGMFADKPPYTTLRLEVQARCPEIRRMTYLGGSENSLAMLAMGTIWTTLETMELKKININPVTLRHALGSLTKLRALKVTSCPVFADDLFQDYEGIPSLPSLAELIISNCPQVTCAGIVAYLSSPRIQKTLKILTATSTGVKTWSLQQILSLAIELEHLSIIDTVDASFPGTSPGQAPTPYLSSKSLHTLHYEITPSSEAGAFAASIAQSHYTYLSSSVINGGLPNLRQLYVRDPTFPDTLLGLPPLMPAFAGEPDIRSRAASAGRLPQPSPRDLCSSGQRPISLALSGRAGQYTGNRINTCLSMNNPFARQVVAEIPATLEVFTKGEEDLDWSTLQMAPDGYGIERRGVAEHVRNASNGRPISSYGLGVDIMGNGAEGWATAGSRRSVMIGDGAGGFLAVPNQEVPPLPKKPGYSYREGGKNDLWPGSRLEDRELWK